MTEALIICWGVLVGLDLIVGPQVMVARPLVAGSVAGWLVGDVVAGASLGMFFELMAADILPFGSARYPDYGLGAVTGTMVAAGAPGPFGIGLALPVGLAMAWLGGLGVHLVKSLNSRHLHALRVRIDAGDFRAIVRVHMAGIGRELVRSFTLVVLGLGIAAVVRRAPTPPPEVLIGSTAVGLGLVAAVATVGSMRLAGAATSGRLWLALGMVGGAAVAVWA